MGRKYFKDSLARLKTFFSLALLGCCFSACGQMDETYADFIKNGTIVYTGKADSVKAFAGRERVKLTWLLMSDPKVSRAMLYWNNRKDSLQVEVHKTAGIDTVQVLLTKAGHGIREGTYLFDVYTFDKSGNRSVKAEKMANVYGAVYQASLLARPINTVKRTTNKVVVDWYEGGKGCQGVELSYTDLAGKPVNLFIPATEASSTLLNYKAGNAFRYRTAFLPEPSAIDTFYTDYTEVLVP